VRSEEFTPKRVKRPNPLSLWGKGGLLAMLVEGAWGTCDRRSQIIDEKRVWLWGYFLPETHAPVAGIARSTPFPRGKGDFGRFTLFRVDSIINEVFGMKRHYIILAIIFFFYCSLFGQGYEFIDLNIEWQGVKVVGVKMEHHYTETDHQIKVAAKSTFLANLFSFEMDNTYQLDSDNLYLTTRYQKRVTQKRFSENSNTLYNRPALLASFFDTFTDTSQEYAIANDTRDFFNALYYLRTLDLTQPHSFTIDNAGKLSRINVKYLGTEKIKTFIGNKDTYKVEISFEHIDLAPRRRSDILTNNLVNPDNKLYFWFTTAGDKIPVKALYRMKKQNVYWIVKSIGIS